MGRNACARQANHPAAACIRPQRGGSDHGRPGGKHAARVREHVRRGVHPPHPEVQPNSSSHAPGSCCRCSGGTEPWRRCCPHPAVSRAWGRLQREGDGWRRWHSAHSGTAAAATAGPPPATPRARPRTAEGFAVAQVDTRGRVVPSHLIGGNVVCGALGGRRRRSGLRRRPDRCPQNCQEQQHRPPLHGHRPCCRFVVAGAGSGRVRTGERGRGRSRKSGTPGPGCGCCALKHTLTLGGKGPAAEGSRGPPEMGTSFAHAQSTCALRRPQDFLLIYTSHRALGSRNKMLASRKRCTTASFPPAGAGGLARPQSHCPNRCSCTFNAPAHGGWMMGVRRSRCGGSGGGRRRRVPFAAGASAGWAVLLHNVLRRLQHLQAAHQDAADPTVLRAAVCHLPPTRRHLGSC